MTHVVAPDRLIAGWWSVATFLLAVGAAWLVNDSGWHWFFVALLAVSVVVWAWFGVQAIAPGLATLRLDAAGMRGRFLWLRVDVDWTDVFLVRVDRLAGDHVLEIVTTEDGRPSRVIPLPVGTSLSAVHRALAGTLGAATTGAHVPPPFAPPRS